MSRFSFMGNDLIYHLQQLVQQPAARRSATYAGSTIGFTIVELLIVIVVIGILAAIVIVAFNGIQSTANDSAVQSDLKNMGSIIQQEYIMKGEYPASLTAAMGIKASKNSYGRGYFNGTSWYNSFYCRVPSGTDAGFAMIAESKSGKVYWYAEGSVREFGYPLASSAVTCARAGINTSATGYSVRFLYSADSWAF